MEKLIYIPGAIYEIPAILSMPACTASSSTNPAADSCCDDRPKSVPAVILCHGTGSQKNEAGNLFIQLADRLARCGIASLRLDFAGCGDSKAPQQALTYYGEVRDVETAYGFLRDHPDIDSGHIGVLGFSQGARVMAEFLRTVPQVSTAVSWSGACQNGMGIFESCFHWFSLYYEEAVREGFATIPMDWREDMLLSREWFEEIRDSRPMDAFRHFPQPVLALAGTEDEIVPCDISREIIAACPHPDSCVKIFPGADHTFLAMTEDQAIAEAVLDTTVQWLLTHL